jgi:hypothetical protein
VFPEDGIGRGGGLYCGTRKEEEGILAGVPRTPFASKTAKVEGFKGVEKMLDQSLEERCKGPKSSRGSEERGGG